LHVLGGGLITESKNFASNRDCWRVLNNDLDAVLQRCSEVVG
jgi:hypothetical protein